MMSELFIGKTKEEIDKIIQNFNNMVTSQEYDEDSLVMPLVLKAELLMCHQRVKCATLGYKAFQKVIGDSHEM